MSKKFSDYTKFIWENDNELYRVLSRREEYIKRQMDRNSEDYTENILGIMEQDLLDTQRSMVEVANKMHKNFDRWLNIIGNKKENNEINDYYLQFIRLCNQLTCSNNCIEPKIIMNLNTLNKIKADIEVKNNQDIKIYGFWIHINYSMKDDLISFQRRNNIEFYDIKIKNWVIPYDEKEN